MPVCGVVVVGPESEDPDFYMATSTTTTSTTTTTGQTQSTTDTSSSNKIQIHKTSLPSSSSFPKNAHHTVNHIRTKPPREEPPLRLLVIGDSLAAGVGMSQSGTPALPEAIARGLSQATGGRAVYWTCVGTPGTTSSEIVQEIVHLDDVIHNNNNNTGNGGLALPSALIQKLTDWQAESRRLANRRLRLAKRRAQKWLEHRKDPVPVDEDDNVEDVEPESKRKLVVQWCKRKAAEIRRDVQGIKQIVVLNGGDDDDDDDDNTEDAKIEAEDARQQKDTTARPSGNLVRRKTLDPEVVGEFDIAIVLTGLNDLKETFIPFMMSAQRQEMLGEMPKGHGGVKEELIRVVHALKSKMNLLIPGKENARTEMEAKATLEGDRDSEKKRKHGPVVVFPALPFSPSILNQRAPLSWFLSPMIRKMDNNKKILSEMYPGIVMFVESPSNAFFAQTEAKKGVVWEDFQRENVLLKLTDIAQNVRERVEETMRQHYKAWVLDAEDEEEGHYDIVADCVTHSHDSKRQRHPGASMVAVDGVHPNDAGYEMWGRYIASIIAKEWKQQ
jgi:lysophospholipase L1-like esterase